MSEQTEKSASNPQTDEQISQSGVHQDNAGDITATQLAASEDKNAALEQTIASQAAPVAQPDLETGDATIAMPIEAQTIQVPALTIEPDVDEAGLVQEYPVRTPSPAPAVPPTTPEPVPSTTPVAAVPNPYMLPADLAQLQMVGGPQVSPDGLLIAYVLLKSSLEENTTRSTIWLVPAVTAANIQSQPPRQLTNDQSNATLPRWSPDGRTLAFVSDRSGSMQIYLLPLNGGEARQVGFFKAGVTDFSWRPDSKALLVQSPWKSDDDQPGATSEEIVQVWTRLDEIWDGQGYKHGRYQHLWLLDLDSEQSATRLTFEPVDHVQACWSPDGQEIAFCVNRRTAPDLSVSMALWVRNLASDRLRRLTPIEGLAQCPAWSPDGKWLAFYFASNQTETANVVPWIVEASGSSAPRPATTVSQNQTSMETIVDNLHFDGQSRPCWYPDSTSLLVTVQAHGQVHLDRLYINTNHEEPLTTGNGCYLSPHMSANGRTIATLRTDWFTPGDIWAITGNGSNRRRLTSVNDALMRTRQLIRPRKVSWRSFDDLVIEGWLYLPPLRAGERAPLVLDIHGGPSLAWAESYVHDFQLLAGQGYAVLVVNPRGSAGYGEEFCRKSINDWGGDDYRDLMMGIDHVIATEPVDASRLAITGLSYGGYMTCWAITQTKRFKAAVARNPVTSLLTCSRLSDQWFWFGLVMGTEDQDQDPETLLRSCSPITFADAITTPLLLLHAAEDLRCPPGESKQLFHALRSRQHPVELAIYPGTSHLLDWPGYGSPRQRVDRLLRTLDWFKKYV